MKRIPGTVGFVLLALAAGAAEPGKPLEVATTDGKRVLRFQAKPEELIEPEIVLSNGDKCTRSTFKVLPAKGAAMYALMLDCPTYENGPSEYPAMHDQLEAFVREISPTETAPVTHVDLDSKEFKLREFRHVRKLGEVRARSYIFQHSSIALMAMWKFDDPIAARDAAAFLDPF